MEIEWDAATAPGDTLSVLTPDGEVIDCLSDGPVSIKWTPPGGREPETFRYYGKLLPDGSLKLLPLDRA